MRGPCLVLSHSNYESDETLTSFFDFKGKHICYIPQNKPILASCHNWLLISDEDSPRNFFLCNSVSYETIHLPSLESKVDQCSCVFTSVPTDPKSLIILCDKFHPQLIFCRPGSERWTVQDIKKEMYTHLTEKWYRFGAVVTLVNAVSIDGKVYALSTDIRLFEITAINSNKLGVKYLEVRFPDLEARFPDISRTRIVVQGYLMESCGELLMVYRESNAKEISRMMVFKMDSSKTDWVKMKSLTDQVLFLGDSCSISCTVSDYPKIKSNSIYFIDNGILHSFNMEYESLSLSKLSFQNIREFYRSNWIILPIRLDIKPVEERGDEEGSEKNEKIKEEMSELKVVVVEEAEERNLSGVPFNVLDLPFHVLEHIGKRLILFDYMYFRATCREFRDAAPSIQWRNAYIESEKDLSPWFMFFKNAGETCNIIDSNPDHRATYLINFPDFLSRATIHFSKNGWLLMSTAIGSFHFFNPCTKMICSLPKTDPNTAPFHIGFTSSPTSPHCLVVGVKAFLHGTLVSFIRFGGEEWGNWICGTSMNKIIEPSNNTPVFYDNRFWVLDDKGNLGVMRVGENYNGIWEVLTQLQNPCISFESNYIVECAGELLSVFVGELGRWVKVFKLDFSEMTWLEVKSLGKNMIFVSRSSCFSAVAKFVGMKNKIYFPRLRGKSIMFYSLETKKIHSFTHEESMEDFQNSSFSLRCAWIEPTWQ